MRQHLARLPILPISSSNVLVGPQAGRLADRLGAKQSSDVGARQAGAALSDRSLYIIQRPHPLAPHSKSNRLEEEEEEQEEEEQQQEEEQEQEQEEQERKKLTALGRFNIPTLKSHKHILLSSPTLPNR